MAFKLGQTVTYLSTSKGDQKLALITATPETITEGTDLPTLNPDHYVITVFSPAGTIYTKFGVPEFGAEGINKEEYVIDGTPRGVLIAIAE